MILHVVVLVVLALITVPEPNKSNVDDLIAETNPGDSVEELDEEPLETVKFEDAPMADVVPTTTTEMSAVEMVEDPTPTLSSATELADIGDVGAMVESMMTSSGSSAKGDLGPRGSTAARKAAVAKAAAARVANKPWPRPWNGWPNTKTRTEAGTSTTASAPSAASDATTRAA